jgi:putative DNA primase/helicase
VRFTNEQAVAVTVWVLMAWTHAKAAVHSPILLATSVEPNSGKTTLLNLISFLAPRSLLCVGISEAALFRGIELWEPTIIVDEADVILVDNEPLRSVINTGHTRGGAVPRCIGDAKVPHAFPTFCPKAIGMKGRKLPDTTLSRCIVIEMKRKKPGESVRHFRVIDDDELRQLREQAYRWANDNGEALKSVEPVMPDGFDNRLSDNWRLMLAITDLAGGEWPELARQAAQRFADAADVTSDGIRLLADIKAVFADDVIGSEDLVKKLTAEPDALWSEWKSNNPITQHQLARLLKPFGISPQQVRLNTGRQVRGYLRASFDDVWERYLTS